MDPQVTPGQKILKDMALRGSPGTTYDDVLGPRGDAYDCKGFVYADTFPTLLNSLLGATDSKTSAPSATTLAAGASAGATTISCTASIAAGSAIYIGTIATPVEAHITTLVSGSGPYTVTLATPVQFTQANGATVGALTAHKFGLLNAASSGSQPPAMTITDYDAFGGYQLAASQLTDLELEWGPDTAAQWTAKFLSNPFTSVSPSVSPSTETFIPAWSSQLVINSTTNAVLSSGKMSMKRDGSEQIFTGGLQSPHSNFAGPIDVTGSTTFVLESGDTMFTLGLTYDKVPMSLVLTDPRTGHFIQFQMSRVQFTDPKHQPKGQYMEVTANFTAEMNTTDPTGSGYANLLAWAGNAVTTAYAGS